MLYNEFLKNIKNDNITSSYLFVGDEEYMMNLTIDNLKNKYIEESFETLNFTKLEGKDTFLDDLINACETLPFMSSKKMVVLKDVSAFLDNGNGDFEKNFYKYIDDLGDYLILIFLDNTSTIKKNTKIYRYFNKQNKAVEFTKLLNNDLISWANSILHKNNKKMSVSDINYFIDNSSYKSKNINVNLYDIENELVKVINYSKNQSITRDDIDKVLIKSIDTNIFELLNAINRNDSETAINVFNDMYQSNEPVPRIFHMITRQIRLLLGYKLYRNKGYDDRLIQDKLGIKDYEFKKIRTQSFNFEVSHLERIMEYLLQMDLKLKTVSNQDKLEMEILLVKLCKK
ncbi:MAG: DNA polymerase III subunit delta [Tissierellaceae bacterium]|nr:DNA polymerase III subunit delta [Tissierellaceae bacterium]